MNIKFKVIGCIVGIFVILYSCSSVKPQGSTQRIIKEKEIINNKPIIINNKTDSVAARPRTDWKLFFEETLKDYKTDNLRLSKEMAGITHFLDSLSKVNYQINADNSRLLYKDLLRQQELLESKEKLLIEKEIRLKTERENFQFNNTRDITDKYISIFLILGLSMNLLFTFGLYLYRKKRIGELS